MRQKRAVFGLRATRLFFIITILALISSACALPGIRLPFMAEETAAPPAEAAPKSAELPTAPPTLAAPAGAVAPTPDPTLPPALVEAQPPSGSLLLPNDGLTFIFSMPMDAESVQRGLATDPQLNLDFTWLDEYTLRVDPAELPAASDVRLTFNENVRSRQGTFLNPAVELAYRTAAPLYLTEQLPAPDSNEANPAAAVVASFSQPVVALSAEPGSLPAGFTLQPAAPGTGEWLNTTTYIFYPESALAGNTDYTVRLNRELTGLADADWSFRTARPQVLEASPRNDNQVYLDRPVTFTFNQPVEPERVEQQFQLIPPEGDPLLGTFTWNEDRTTFTFTPDDLLERNTRYRAVLPAQSVGEGSGLGEDFIVTFQTVDAFNIASTNPAVGTVLEMYETGYQTLILDFTTPLANGQNFDELITVSPEIVDQRITVGEMGARVFLAGFFQPAARYSVRLAPELTDRWGQKLGEPVTLDFRTATAKPSLTIPMLQVGVNILFALPSDTSLSARATNIETVQIGATRLGLADFLRIASNLYDADWPTYDDYWDIDLSLPKDTNRDIDIPLTKNGTSLEPGLYAYDINSLQAVGQSVNRLSPFLLVVSNTALTLKRSRNEVFIWAVDAVSAQPLDGLEVTLYDDTGSVLNSGVTQGGVVSVPLPVGFKPYDSVFVVSGQPGEDGFSLATTGWGQGLGAWEFSLGGGGVVNGPLVYLYTDRPIYQPGQEVSFRAIARQADNGRYALLDRGELLFTLFGPSTGPEPNIVYQDTLPLSDYGTAQGTLTLPESAVPGEYNLTIGDEFNQSISFKVANYRKPTIDVQVSFDPAEILPGQPVQAAVNAAYYFGAPAADVPVTWVLTGSKTGFTIPDGFRTGKFNQYWLEPMLAPITMFGRYITEGEGRTGADGQLTITVDPQILQDALDPESTYELTLEVTAQDESQQPVSARGVVRLFGSELFAGLRSDAWMGRVDEEMGFDVKLVDWQGQAGGAQPLSALFQKVTYRRSDPQSVYLSPLEPVYTPVASANFQTSSAGTARLAFTPSEPGTYMLEVRGETMVSQIMMWVSGPGSAPWPDVSNSHINLTANAERYRPGESAQVFIPNPFTKGAVALITVERGKVMRWQVLEIAGTSTTVELPLSQEDAPNVYVSVTLLGQEEDGRTSFRQGYVELEVDPAERLLNVELAAQPRPAAPGDTVQLALRVTDTAGSPVQGEFSVAVVDKAALALADPNSDPIEKVFYSPRMLGVSTSSAFASYIRREVMIVTGRGGGGGGSMNEPGSVRDRFADTAYWNGNIVTDAGGFAQVELALPDNLTTWVVDVRGIDGDTRAGQGSLDVTASKMLMVQPVTPRFFIAGDHAVVSALVFNQTAQQLSVNTTLQAEGFALDALEQAAQQITLKPGERKQLTWWGTAQGPEQVRLVFTAEGGGLRDSVTPEGGVLPVLRFSAPETFSTAGMLAEAGQRQELVSLPRSYPVTGGALDVELSSSLAGVLISGVEALKTYPKDDLPISLASRLLPNLEAYRTLTSLGVDNPTLKDSLDDAIRTGISGIVRTQNEDGGWGWSDTSDSQPYLSAYIVLALGRAADAGAEVPAAVLENGQAYLLTNVQEMDTTEAWQKDRAVFITWVLWETGAISQPPLPGSAQWREELSPWARAFQALNLQSTDSQQSALLIQDLQDSAVRTATGVHWEDSDRYFNNANNVFTTAAVTIALARLEPASPLLVDAVRYLASTRSANGVWFAPYDSAWALTALSEALKGTGDLQAGFSYSAALNTAPLASGEASPSSFNPVTASVPVSNLAASGSNRLQIQRGDGSGRLYYRAFLQIDRPVESAQPVNKGLVLDRSYTLMDAQGCAEEGCPAATEAQLRTGSQIVLVRLTLTALNDVSSLVVEDYIPAGAEILDSNLKTSQQAFAEAEPQEVESPFDLRNPYANGWGWWFFDNPQIYDNRVRWTVENLPAGTYQLTYRLVLTTAGEFRVLPARAYNYFFPEVQGTSAGSIFTIRPQE